jgi:HEAT repeats/von Willebrand factor type A domain
MVTPLLLSLLLLAPFGKADQVKEAIAAVEHGFKDGITPERQLALTNLGKHDDPRCVDEILMLFDRGEVPLFPDARKVLGGYSAAATMARLTDKGFKHKNPIVREQVLWALGEAQPAAFDWRTPLRAGLDDAEPRVRAVAVRCLGRARDDARLDRITALAADPVERVRLEVPESISRLAGVRSEPTLEALLVDPRWRVRLAAAHAMADLHVPEVVLPLIERLPLEPGRVREDLLDLLERLTGRQYEMDIEAWRKFIKEAPPDFLKDGDAVAAGTKTVQARASTGVRQHTLGTKYHTIGTLSRRFVLVTDLSGSMDSTIPPHTGDTAPPLTRLATAQHELDRLIESLAVGDCFDLVTFSDAARSWKGRLFPATDTTRRAAQTEIASWTPSGNTDVFDALRLCFDMAEKSMDAPGPTDGDFDTLFLLSDGEPSGGLVSDKELLLDYVGERNRTLQLRLHCISLAGGSQARDFLKRLATLGGGGYVEAAPDK